MYYGADDWDNYNEIDGGRDEGAEPTILLLLTMLE